MLTSLQCKTDSTTFIYGWLKFSATFSMCFKLLPAKEMVTRTASGETPANVHTPTHLQEMLSQDMLTSLATLVRWPRSHLVYGVLPWLLGGLVFNFCAILGPPILVQRFYN